MVEFIRTRSLRGQWGILTNVVGKVNFKWTYFFYNNILTKFPMINVLNFKIRSWQSLKILQLLILQRSTLSFWENSLKQKLKFYLMCMAVGIYISIFFLSNNAVTAWCVFSKPYVRFLLLRGSTLKFCVRLIGIYYHWRKRYI